MTIERKGLILVPVSAPEPKGEEKDPFPGEFEARCKICQIVRDHPDLARLIHDMHFRDRASYRNIAEEANVIIAREGIALAPVQISSFVPHFSKHVPGIQAYVYEMQAKALPRPRTPQSSELMKQIVAARHENLSQLRENFTRWQKIFDTVTNEMGLDKKDGNGNPVSTSVSKEDISRLKDATQAMGVLMRMMDGYIKDRSFVLDVLDKGIYSYGSAFIARLALGLRRIVEQSKTRSQTDPKSFEWFRDEIRQLIENSLVGLVDVARDETMERFNL